MGYPLNVYVHFYPNERRITHGISNTRRSIHDAGQDVNNL